MKINTKEKPLQYKPTVPLEIEICPICLQDLEQDYSMHAQLFNFECPKCRCEDNDISQYRVQLLYDEFNTQDHKWSQEFSIKNLYVKTDLQTMSSILYNIRGPLLENGIPIDFLILNLENRIKILNKFSIYSTFS